MTVASLSDCCCPALSTLSFRLRLSSAMTATAMFYIDLMDDEIATCRLLRSWSRELGLHGQLFLPQAATLTNVFIVLDGEPNGLSLFEERVLSRDRGKPLGGCRIISRGKRDKRNKRSEQARPPVASCQSSATRPLIELIETPCDGESYRHLMHIEAWLRSSRPHDASALMSDVMRFMLAYNQCALEDQPTVAPSRPSSQRAPAARSSLHSGPRLSIVKRRTGPEPQPARQQSALVRARDSNRDQILDQTKWVPRTLTCAGGRASGCVGQRAITAFEAFDGVERSSVGQMGGVGQSTVGRARGVGQSADSRCAPCPQASLPLTRSRSGGSLGGALSCRL